MVKNICWCVERKSSGSERSIGSSFVWSGQMNVLDKWFGQGDKGGGLEETMSFHYFFQNLPRYDCFGIEYNEIIKAFIALSSCQVF